MQRTCTDAETAYGVGTCQKRVLADVSVENVEGGTVMKQITPDMIREEFMGCVRDLLLWEMPDGESGRETMMRSLFYLQGAYDLANELIARLEGSK